jgi:hypothetical protein
MELLLKVSKPQKQNTKFCTWEEVGKHFARFLDDGRTWYFDFEIY